MDGRAKTSILKNHSPFYFGYSAGKTHEPGFWGPHGISDDKGNNSKDSMVLLDDTPYHFVGSLKPYDYKHFLEIALEKFRLVPMENGEEAKKKDDIFAYRTREEVLGAERTVVVTYEQKLFVVFSH